jgi:hypothetical protein
MGLFTIPDPVGMYESAKNAGLARNEATALVSGILSAAITLAWGSGSAKWALWFGEGQALKDCATVAYLTLHQRMIEGLPLVLTVPHDLLDANNLARFQTMYQEKK